MNIECHRFEVASPTVASRLGRWQSIIFADLDGPQKRSFLAQIIGE